MVCSRRAELQNAVQLETEEKTSPYRDAPPIAAAGGDAALDVTYRITFYADAVDGESATPIQLRPGERANADITLRAVPAVHLTIRNASADPQQPGSAVIQQKVFNCTLVPILARTQPSAQGTLTISGIPPGHAVVNLRSFSGKEWKDQVREVDVSTDTEIDAADSSASTIEIHGRVQIPGAMRSLPEPTFVSLTGRRNGGFGAPVSAKGEFEVKQNLIGASDYEVAVINARGLMVQRIATAGAKVSGRTLTLPHSGTVELTVTMSEQAGRIDGTVLRDGKSLSQAMVVLVPESFQGNADLMRRDQSDSDGTFTLYQVLPGRYRVIADRKWLGTRLAESCRPAILSRTRRTH